MSWCPSILHLLGLHTPVGYRTRPDRLKLCAIGYNDAAMRLYAS